MYSIEMFGRMLTDHRRHGAMMAALERLVRPGDVVLDIGTGFGFYALVAAQLGARKVYAVEPNPLVSLGPKLARTNGLSDRIEFIQDVSTAVTLPELADLVIADLRGTLPFYSQHLPSMRDARARHLKPGGSMIPTTDRIFAAVSTNQAGAEYVDRVWTDGRFGFDLSHVRDLAACEFRRDRVSSDQLITEPVQVGSIDYRQIEDVGLAFEGDFRATHDGIADGFSLWFDATVLETTSAGPAIEYSTHPDNQPMIYGMAFLPFGESIELRKGDIVHAALRCDLVDDYQWTWSACGDDASGARWERSHSTFGADILDPKMLRGHRASETLPSDAAALVAADLLALELLSRGTSFGSTADAVASAHPSIFPNHQVALDHVVIMAARYST